MSGTTASVNPTRSFLAVTAGAVITASVTGACTALSLPQYVTSAIVAVALAVPSTVVFGAIRRRRDPRTDLARLRSGRLDRSAPIAVALFAVALFAFDTLLGFVNQWLGVYANIWLFFLMGSAGSFLLGLRAGHYVGRRPFVATVVVVGIATVLRYVVGIAALVQYGIFGFFWTYWWWAWLIAAAVYLLGSGVGVYVGRLDQAAFVARKADRLAARLRERRPVAPPPAPGTASPSSAGHGAAALAPPPYAPSAANGAPLPPPRAEDRRLD